MTKKLIRTIAIFAIILLSTSPVFALTANTQNAQNNETTNGVVPGVTSFELVEKKLCQIDIKDPVSNETVGEFTKELTNFDANKKEATLTLTVKNLFKENEPSKKPLEIFLVLDNSNSMTKTYNDKNKMEYVIDSAKQFATSLLEKFENCKIGVVSFSSVKTAEGATYGTLNDAKLLSPLSDSKDTILSKIAEYKNETGSFTNIEAGISIAESNFTDSEDSEKYIIVLSDGVPNLCLNTETTLLYSGVVAESTRKKLQDLYAKGYHMYSILMGLNEADLKAPSISTAGNPETPMTYGQLAEEIFGTSEKPVVPSVGKYFHIDYENLYDTINESIYNDITDIDTSIKSLIIKDYFPKEIIENFNFEYVKSPNIGKVSQTVDKTDNSITWNIEVLNAGEVATLSYKLTLKDNYNKEIVDKILPTNSKVDIDFEYDGNKGEATSTDSSTVRVRYVESDKDETITKKPIPQTGSYTTALLVVAFVGIAFAITRLYFMKKIK